MPGLPSLTAFAGLGPPWSLSQLDANFTNISNLLKSVNNYSPYVLDAGGANAYSATYGGTLTFTLATGAFVIFQAANANTGASTLSVNGGGAVTIKNANGTDLLPGQISAGSQVAVVYNGTNWIIVGAANALGPVNQVINGSFNFLRDSSVTNAFATPSTVSYLLQRWYAYQNGGGAGSLGVSQILGGPASSGIANVNKMGYPYCARVQRTAGASITDSRFATVIPTAITRQLTNRPLILQFFARAGADYTPAALSLPVTIVTGTAADQGAASLEAGTWTGQTVAYSGSVTLTTTYQEFTLLIPALPTNVLELAIRFPTTWVGAVAPALDYFDIAGVRLGVAQSNNASCVELPPDEDLRRCRWFFETIGDVSPGAGQVSGAVLVSTQTVYCGLNFSIKRIVPALTVSLASHFSIESAGALDACTSITVVAGTMQLDRARLNAQIGTPRTAGQGANLVQSNVLARVYVDAEL